MDDRSEWLYDELKKIYDKQCEMTALITINSNLIKEHTKRTEFIDSELRRIEKETREELKPLKFHVQVANGIFKIVVSSSLVYKSITFLISLKIL